MVALVVGGECRLINEVIAKLNKGGHRVYLLTEEGTISYPTQGSLKNIAFPMTATA